ncbi:MAG TPA: DNA-3-methyladenine glycosylase [Acidimicrobiia bacterium]|nr:DNA-3-methyladenine glycosylase [Acidimicrobiia bacterium]
MSAPDFFRGEVFDVAPRLLGWRIVSELEGELTEVELNEVEAYNQDDPASHSYRGPRPGNEVMFGLAGFLYVYRSYGIHWCANVVCGPGGFGAAVLMRGGTAVSGHEVMMRRRGRVARLVQGPGNLAQAMAITGEHNGLDLFDPHSPVRLESANRLVPSLATPRIGISKATDRLWRFVPQA